MQVRPNNAFKPNPLRYATQSPTPKAPLQRDTVVAAYSEQKPQLLTAIVRSYDLRKYILVNAKDKSVWRGDNDRGWQRVEDGPITVLTQHAAGKVHHLRAGQCPVELAPGIRDPGCPVCQTLVALGH